MLIHKGGKKKRKKKTIDESSRELKFTEDGQDYAYVVDLLGHKRCNVKLFNSNRECLGIIRGNMRSSSSRVCKGDIVLVSLRDYQESKCDIFHVFKRDEVNQLIMYEEINQKFVYNDESVHTSNYVDVEFQDIAL